MKITVEDGVQISEEAADELRKHADMIECQCYWISWMWLGILPVIQSTVLINIRRTEILINGLNLLQ